MSKRAVLILALALALTGAVPAAANAADFKRPRSALIVKHRIRAHKHPRASSKPLRTLQQFRSDYRPQIVLVLGQRRVKDRLWYRINLPLRPNNQTGWVRASELERLRVMKQRIVIDRSKKRLSFYDRGRRVLKVPIGVGTPDAATPLGDFYVAAGFNPRAPVLGAYAFETSAGASITDWPGGGVIGIHGTPWPELLPGAVSHGCIRLRNGDVRKLKHKLVLGTPIRIKA
jgi:lipoprotein-anchoring transpeptidase ErfK/SrfK